MSYENYVLRYNGKLPKSIQLSSNKLCYNLSFGGKVISFPIGRQYTHERALQAAMRCWKHSISHERNTTEKVSASIRYKYEGFDKCDITSNVNETHYHINTLKKSVKIRNSEFNEKDGNIVDAICDYRFRMKPVEIEVEKCIFPELSTSTMTISPINWYIKRDELYKRQYYDYFLDMLKMFKINEQEWMNKDSGQKLIQIQNYYHVHVITSIYSSQWYEGRNVLYCKLTKKQKEIIDKKIEESNPSDVFESAKRESTVGNSKYMKFRELLIFRRYCEEYHGNYYHLLKDLKQHEITQMKEMKKENRKNNNITIKNRKRKKELIESKSKIMNKRKTFSGKEIKYSVNMNDS